MKCLEIDKVIYDISFEGVKSSILNKNKKNESDNFDFLRALKKCYVLHNNRMKIA